jgi:hypothetical protein
MKTGEDYLNELGTSPPETFASKFANSATRLHLGTALDATELEWLHESAFVAALCHMAINGQGAWGGMIEREQEPNRSKLESEFMVARDKLYASAGWQALPSSARQLIQRRFLRIHVNEDNLVV